MCARAAAPSALAIDTHAGTLVVAPELAGRLEPLGDTIDVPLAPPLIAGVAELRGRVITLVDPGRLARILAPGPRPSACIEASTKPDDAAPAPKLPSAALVLAPPREHLALLLPAGTRARSLAEGSVEGARLDAAWLDALLDEIAPEWSP